MYQMQGKYAKIGRNSYRKEFIMKIYESPTGSFLEFTGLDKVQAPVISVVGAGGKTSLIYAMSKEFSNRKIHHGIFTTTHMWPVAEEAFRHTLGSRTPSGKMGPPKEEDIEKLFAEKIPVLIESDGSKGFPCKAPEAWEPVLREETTHVFGVIGASCLGKTVEESCHRPGRVMELLKCSPGHRLTPGDLAELGASPWGLKKNVKPGQWFGIVINQVDTDWIYDEIKQIREQFRQKGVEHIFFVRMMNK